MQTFYLMKQFTDFTDFLSFCTNEVFVEAMLDKNVFLPFIFHFRYHFQKFGFGLTDTIRSALNADSGRPFIRDVDHNSSFLFKTIHIGTTLSFKKKTQTENVEGNNYKLKE